MTKEVATIAGIFDKTRTDRLRKAYANCKDETFMFRLSDGVEHEMLKAFAKYLIEYLETQGL